MHEHKPDWRALCLECQRLAERPLYDTCGCIAPCPDHKSIAQDGRRDREYWDDRYASDDTE